jgi:hypothetical protein
MADLAQRTNLALAAVDLLAPQRISDLAAQSWEAAKDRGRDSDEYGILTNDLTTECRRDVDVIGDFRRFTHDEETV